MRRSLVVLGAVVAIAAVAVYAVTSATPMKPQPVQARTEALEPTPVAADEPIAVAPPTATLASVAVAPTPEQEEPPIDPAHPERFRSHPITAYHAGMAEQRALLEGIETALKARDIARARELLAQHRERFTGAPGEPLEAWRDLRDGYEIMADCIEQPGPEARAKAERFIEDEASSSLRRRVRHTCLGPQKPTLLPPR